MPEPQDRNALCPDLTVRTSDPRIKGIRVSDHLNFPFEKSSLKYAIPDVQLEYNAEQILRIPSF